MIRTAIRNKNKGLSIIASVLMGAAVFGLQSCSSSDGTPPASVTVTGGSVIEGDTGTQSIAFTVDISAPAGANTSVDYATSDGTAVAGADYIATTGRLTIPANATSATVTVDVVGDTAFEFDETFLLTLSNPVAAVLGTVASANGTITNDDDADTKGYFTGVATVNSTNFDDITGIAYNNRLMVFSPTANVLYDIAITNVTVTDFTGTVEVYVNGSVLPGSITISGTTNESQVQGVFAGSTGFAAGSFDILFDTSNNRGATLARINTEMGFASGNLYGFTTETGKFSSDDNGHYVGFDDGNPSCGHIGDFVIPDPTLNIYPMAHDIVENLSCAFLPSTGHTGLVSVVDTVSTDDTIVYAFANGTLSLFAILTK